jgi:hypothetical protein
MLGFLKQREGKENKNAGLARPHMAQPRLIMLILLKYINTMKTIIKKKNIHIA